MNEISRNTLELLLQTFEASSKDETRINLNTVRLGRNQDGVMVLDGCDGHILARHYIVEEFELDESILIHKVGKSKLSGFLKTNKSYNMFDIDLDVETNRNLRIYTKDQRDGIIMPVVFREYAKIDAVIPTKLKEEDILEISINPELLMRLYKSLNKGSRIPRVVLKVNKNNNTTPIMVSSGESNLGIIMPVRN